MRRLRIDYRQGAIGDLRAIYEFLRERGAGASTARDYVRRMRTACARIGDAPEGGTSRDDLMPGLRTWSFERRALIAYRVVPDAVQITNIFYGGRDVDAFYARERRRTGIAP